MLDAQELRRRVIEAMEKAKPPLTSAALAAACKVTPQAVNGWRKTGRIAKKHLQTIAELTGKPLEYFLGSDAQGGAGATYRLAIEEAEAIVRLRKGPADWRRYVLGLAMMNEPEANLMLKTMRQAVPDYEVERAYGKAPHVAAREKIKK